MTAVGDALLRLALVSLHSVLWLREAASCVYLWLWSSMVYILKHKGKQLECIAADRRELRKVPAHLALVVQEEWISCDDLAQVAMWAFASDIQTVSLYDPYGNIMKEMVFLGKQLHHQHRQLFSPPLPELEVLTSQEAASAAIQPADASPDFSSEICRQRHRVVVLSGECGLHGVVETAVGVCQSALERGGGRGVGDGTHLDVDTISNRITSHLGLPDPELAVVFGRVCSTVGYPPWQLRLTEIHTIPSHHKVTYQQFLQVLQQYSACQQRCGK